jgi:hypothetical protein
MARARRKRVFWTPKDLKLLRKLAGRQTAVRIAKQLKRSVLAVRFKAHKAGISLAHKKARRR